MIVCANCRQGNGLWRAVSVETGAWQRIEPTKHQDNPGRVEEVNLYIPDEITSVQSYGCSNCCIEGKSRDELLIEIDLDGEEVVQPSPGQERVDV